MSAVFFCLACNTEMVSTAVARWPDGRIKEATWDCECGKAHGWYADGGTLDLEEVRKSVLRADSSFEVFVEEVSP